MASSVRWTGRTAATLLAVAVAAALLLSGGFPESVYSLLAAAVWLALAAAAVTAGVGRPSAAVWALAALCVWTLLSALWGPAGPALRAAPLVALYAGALWAAEHVEPRVLLRSVWCACVAAATVALAARLGGVAPEAAGPASARLSWPTGYANGLALVSVSGLLLSFAQPRRWAWSGGAICALAALATFSRGGLLAGVVGLVVLAAVRGRVGRRVALAAAAIAAVAAVALAQPLAARFAAPAPDERDARRLLDVSGHGRSDLWRVAWEEGLEHPLAGAGGGTWARAYVADTGSPSAPANAHSLPLETWAELGLVGVLLLAAFAVAVAAAARSNFVFLQHKLPERAAAEVAPAAAVVAAWAVMSLGDWVWQLPAATLPALLAAGALTAGRASVAATQSSTRPGPPADGRAAAVAAACLAVGVAAAAHGVGAALLEGGDAAQAERLLPWDARPAVARGDLGRACAIDPGELAIARAAAAADPPAEGCRRSGSG